MTTRPTRGRRYRQRAFTLLEVLVVLLIIGVMTGLAMLSMSGATLGERLETEARRLSELMRLASDTAILRSAQIGLRLSADGYRFMILDVDGWRTLDEGGPLRPRPLPEPLAARLYSDGLALPTADEEDDGDGEDDDRIRPQVLFLSSGEITPFRLDLSAPGLDAAYRITGRLGGGLETARVGPDRG